MKIKFSELKQPKADAIAVMVRKDSTLGATAKTLDEAAGGALTRAIAADQFSGKADQSLTVMAPEGIAAGRVILLGMGSGDDVTALNLQKIGGRLCQQLWTSGAKNLMVVVDGEDGDSMTPPEMAAEIGYGAYLGSYRFEKYKTTKKDKPGQTLKQVDIAVIGAAKARKAYGAYEKIADGVIMTRDLVSEPGNVLYPESFAATCKTLKDLGVKVEVLGEKQMAKLGMNALLGVGQGSARESKMVIMQWSGGRRNAKPVAFVGKGVTFDTGGISLKPGPGMEEMKWDMGGAGTVVGLMKALAGRKAKTNAVGVIGCVENMPSGKAQRPGDIVTSLSGQTIEILNTDAEGRLVLADALWYTEDRFKPAFMIDLATLTGAMIVALGHEYAGMFSNDDTLSERLSAAGTAEGEGVWRMPLAKAYDKLIDSPAADMQNIGGRAAGSITAGQFLQRFVRDVPWAHLDIAGMAWSKKATPTVPKGGTGWGVRLLDRLVRDHYES